MRRDRSFFVSLWTPNGKRTFTTTVVAFNPVDAIEAARKLLWGKLKQRTDLLSRATECSPAKATGAA